MTQEYETFRDYSTRGLMDLAEDFHTSLASVNGSSPVPSNVPPMAANVVASAGPEGLRLNFSSRAVIGMVLSEMTNIEGVIDEGWRRLGETSRPARHASLLASLETEARKCLDLQFARPVCHLRDLHHLARDVGRRFGPSMTG